MCIFEHNWSLMDDGILWAKTNVGLFYTYTQQPSIAIVLLSPKYYNTHFIVPQSESSKLRRPTCTCAIGCVCKLSELSLIFTKVLSLPRMRRGYVSSRICTVYVCNTLTCASLGLESYFLVCLYIFRNKFVYQGYRSRSRSRSQQQESVPACLVRG